MISVIICTYKRAETLKEVLESLKHQEDANFELLIIDGSGDDTKPYNAVKQFEDTNKLNFPVHFIKSEKGLTKQRNVGLKAANGDIIAFFDDDVTFDKDFLAKVQGIFNDDTNNEIAGITGYDIRNYPASISLRLKLNVFLKLVPNLNPGYADHLGRHTPISILNSSIKKHEINWLSGYCMIYKSEKIKGLQFDEELPTYAGEDFDFSMNANTKGKLFIYSSLKISHNYSTEDRSTNLKRIWEVGFGAGRSFKLRKNKWSDNITIVYYPVAMMLSDFINFLFRPSSDNFKLIFAKFNGYTKGLKSVK